MDYPKFKVSVRCMTFNHSKYINDCMNGFAMQHTDFPFVCCIVDDASTDGEQDVINSYLNEHFDFSDSATSFKRETDYAFVIYARHKENKNCHFAVLLLKYNHYSIRKDKSQYLTDWTDTPYCAFCEGDDYWIDANKLQKQANALDSHPDCYMCVHTTKKVNHDGSFLNQTFPSVNLSEGIIDSRTSISLLQDDFSFHLTSQLIRGDKYNYYIKNLPRFTKVAKCGDVPLLLYFGQLGNIYYFKESMSCYRLCTEGSHTDRMLSDVSYRNSFYDSIEEMMLEYDKYTNHKYKDICKTITLRYRFLQLQVAHFTGLLSTTDYNKAAVNRKFRYQLKKQYPFKVRILMYLSVAFPFINRLVNHNK